ncbi:U1 small nuclear ribonucleoprotein [Pseudocercospora fuligena]|uniref:U1 small nuclear ribonucleoprotein n=1 Tax=Pseudocercospora fuligena TaxID=685502 RepID=A0A8H6RAF2_9PEZI|nr:U1 small nuclear ribonucleoprotein [Pseudocercospora fuligena]
MAEDGNPPNATLYVRGIDEKIKIPTLIQEIHDTFGEFGTIIDVVAKKNLKARGQAFVVFESPEEAEIAMEALQGFDLLGQPVTIAFAKTRSDATIKKDDGDEELEKWKQVRLAEKERKKAEEAAAEAAKPAKRPADSANLAERPAKSTKPSNAMADEYLPPNKTLILRDFPDEYGKDELSALFARFPGFKEVRVVPGRKGLAFAEYEDEIGGTAAKEAMHGQELGEKTIRVTYQRQ